MIGGAKPFFECFLHIQKNASLSFWANSCALIGYLAGALASGILSDKFGRKRLLIAAPSFDVTSVGKHDEAPFLPVMRRMAASSLVPG